jgi:hypothetical protein
VTPSEYAGFSFQGVPKSALTAQLFRACFGAQFMPQKFMPQKCPN